MTTYKIMRYFKDRRNEVVETGVSLKQAQAHCSDPETSSRTCTSSTGVSRTMNHGDWFDGYTAE